MSIGRVPDLQALVAATDAGLEIFPDWLFATSGSIHCD